MELHELHLAVEQLEAALGGTEIQSAWSSLHRVAMKPAISTNGWLAAAAADHDMEPFSLAAGGHWLRR